MTDRNAHVTTNCPECTAPIEISQNWTAGGMNDYGGWVLKCNACSNAFPFHLGRDIYDSSVIKGATVLDTYNDEVGDKEMVLARHGIS